MWFHPGLPLGVMFPVGVCGLYSLLSLAIESWPSKNATPPSPCWQMARSFNHFLPEPTSDSLNSIWCKLCSLKFKVAMVIAVLAHLSRFHSSDSNSRSDSIIYSRSPNYQSILTLLYNLLFFTQAHHLGLL